MKGYLYDTGDEIIKRKDTSDSILAVVSTEYEVVTINSENWKMYSVGHTFNELTSNICFIQIDDGLLGGNEGQTDTFYPFLSLDNYTSIEGYPYELVVQGVGTTVGLNASSANGILYLFVPNT